MTTPAQRVGMTAQTPATLTDDEQQARRDWFRRHWDSNIPFHLLCRVEVRHWDTDRVELVSRHSDELSSHPGIFHGGVISTLVDTAGCAAVLAGHDFTRGSRVSTAALSVQYLAVARGENIVATGRAIKRGRTVNVAEVVVTGESSGKVLATGQVTATVEGERPGLLGPLPGDRPTEPRPEP